MDTNEPAASRRLTGRVCVIAGAAGAIGETVAQRLTSEGGVVVGIDLKPHETGVLSLIADLTDEDQVRDAYARIHRELGLIDVIYNNAGGVDLADRSALETSPEV